MEDGNSSGSVKGTISFGDLFSGIGAMRLGFEQACLDFGINPRCIGFSEINKPAIRLYRRRFPDTVALGDIRGLSASKDMPTADLVLGGFPCPSYSKVGRNLGFNDERGKLFFALARVIGKARPKAFLLENVKELETRKNGKTLDAILDVLEQQLGYTVRHAVLNSRNFGVPQNRPRIYFVGFRNGGESFQFPTPTDSAKRLKDVLETEPVHSRHFLTESTLERMRRHKARHEARGNGFGFRLLDPAKEVTGTLLCSGFGREQNLVIDQRLDQLSLLPGRKSPLNHDHIRQLTPLEWERLQGLPDNFTDGQTVGHRYRQLGNAVTVPVIRAVCRIMLSSMA